MPQKLPAGSCSPPGPELEPASMQVDPEQLGQISQLKLFACEQHGGGAFDRGGGLGARSLQAVSTLCLQLVWQFLSMSLPCSCPRVASDLLGMWLKDAKAGQLHALRLWLRCSTCVLGKDAVSRSCPPPPRPHPSPPPPPPRKGGFHSRHRQTHCLHTWASPLSTCDVANN